MKSFIHFIKDCKRFTHKYPYKKGEKALLLYWRNVFYINAQTKYLWGRVLTKLLGSRVVIKAITPKYDYKSV